MKYDYIIFDMDGVIVDVNEIQKCAVFETCKKFGITITELDWNKYKGLNSEQVFREITFENPQTTNSIDELIEYKKSLTKKEKNNIKLITGVTDFIEFLVQNKFILGLATNSSVSNQQSIFKIFGLGKYFSSIITGNIIKNLKPDPEIYIKSMQNLNSKPENTIIIEDSYAGTKAGIDSGAKVITIATSHNQTEIKSWGFDNLIVTDYNELQKIVTNLNY